MNKNKVKLKETVREDRGGILVVILLFVVGVGMLYYALWDWDFSIEQLSSKFYDYGLLILVSLLFISMCGCAIIYLIKDSFSREVCIEAMLSKINDLKEIEDITNIKGYILVFQDKKGRSYFMNTVDVQELGLNKIYNITVKHNSVKTINYLWAESSNYEPAKDKFWTTIYLPGEKIENILLLPIFYCIMLICLLVVFFARTIFSLVIASIPTILAAYDIYMKITNRNKKQR